ncbi:uncharacterized protein PHACADRAFT_255338 [Phanerochaete carnosa HHB-10118-sp]|uniref:DUF7598 domain-containing protein n=1 Tax=Phanerochaete carnosa (strain HHB-10118-sp) TaxID=650164 RepID=K5WX23_PHACS|nr:uncharacterized protein PHACADRAFT_255338 [Phanerochaete carnosa HHB-10118-sp]EKM55027.1 hypothetical protein PHACADRAFT_255338 [Phanerochaete carnosa HHB-10118-sp]
MMLPPRAYVFIGLNAVRILSIIAMLLVFASSIFVLVNDVEAVNNFMKNASDQDFADCDYIENSTVPNQPAGVFWAVVNRLFIIFQIIVLILSEVGWPLAFFDRYFPVLGSGFGLGPLGVFQCLIGATILSHHVDDFTLVAAFFLFALGCLNIVLGLVFRESAKARRSFTSWRTDVNDARPRFARPQSGFVAGIFNRDPEKQASYGFGNAGEKKAGLKGFLISRPLETLPRFATQPRADRDSAPEPRFKSSTTAI